MLSNEVGIVKKTEGGYFSFIWPECVMSTDTESALIVNDIEKPMKEIWFSAAVSWLFPGLGQIYAGRYIIGFALAGVYLIAYIFSRISILFEIFPISFSLAVIFFEILILPTIASLGYALWASHHIVHNTQEYVEKRRPKFFALLLSVILPGLGHACMKRATPAILFATAFLILKLFSGKSLLAFAGIPVLQSVCLLHVYYYLNNEHNDLHIKNAIKVFSLVLCSALLSECIFPMLTVAYLIQRPLGIVGVSMEPTLKSTDKVVVDIVTYRFRPPRVGEVVIFNPPFSHNYKGVPDGASETFCKRIVAVGGEEVLLKDGIVYVDGVKRVFGRKIEDNVSSENSSKTQRPILRKQGEIYGVIRPYRVPSGYYFVLGDNIANSEDSRFFEAIPRQAITGKVTKIYLPWSRAGPVD